MVFPRLLLLLQVCSAAGVRFTSAEVVDIRVVEDGRATQLVTRDGEVYKSRWAAHWDRWRKDEGVEKGLRALCDVCWEAVPLEWSKRAGCRAALWFALGPGEWPQVQVMGTGLGERHQGNWDALGALKEKHLGGGGPIVSRARELCAGAEGLAYPASGQHSGTAHPGSGPLLREAPVAWHVAG